MAVNTKLRLEVLKDYNWHCGYCGKPLFFAPTLQLLNQLNPNSEYWDAHGSEKRMVKLLADLWMSVDHLVPVSKEGPDTRENLAAACMACNRELSNKTKDKKTPEKKESAKWDGLSGAYPALCLFIKGDDDDWSKLIKEKAESE